MTDALSILRVPPAALDLSASHEFQKMQVLTVSLSVDADARKRIEASKTAGPEAAPFLVEMLDQDRTTSAAGDLVAKFKTHTATVEDGRRAENMAAFAEADLACHIAAQDALVRLAAVPALTEALKSSSPNRKIGAAKALGQIGKPALDAVPLLKTLERDSSEMVRKAATAAVKQIKPGWF